MSALTCALSPRSASPRGPRPTCLAFRSCCRRNTPFRLRSLPHDAAFATLKRTSTPDWWRSWTHCASATSRSRCVACGAALLGLPPLTTAACCALWQLYAEASRRVATYGTWGLLAVNTALFLGTQLVVEPSKRRRTEASMRAAVAEQGDRILAGLPAVSGARQQQHGASTTSDDAAVRQTALLGVLHAIDARQATMAARLDALASARSRPEEAVAAPSNRTARMVEEHAGLPRDRVAALRFALTSAWAALPPGPLTGARSDWVAGVVGCAAVGGIASGGLLLAALGLASGSGR